MDITGAADVAARIERYVLDRGEELPILKEVCLIHEWDYDELCELAELHPDVRRAVNRLFYRREVNLERGGVLGNFNKPMTTYLLDRMDREREAKEKYRVLDRVDAVFAGYESLADSSGGGDRGRSPVQGFVVGEASDGGDRGRSPVQGFIDAIDDGERALLQEQDDE